MTGRRYIYLGDKLTDPALKMTGCRAVTTADGKCVVGRGAMLVRFDDEPFPRVVLRRRLRRVETLLLTRVLTAADAKGRFSTEMPTAFAPVLHRKSTHATRRQDVS